MNLNILFTTLKLSRNTIVFTFSRFCTFIIQQRPINKSYLIIQFWKHFRKRVLRSRILDVWTFIEMGEIGNIKEHLVSIIRCQYCNSIPNKYLLIDTLQVNTQAPTTSHEYRVSPWHFHDGVYKCLWCSACPSRVTSAVWCNESCRKLSPPSLTLHCTS